MTSTASITVESKQGTHFHWPRQPSAAFATARKRLEPVFVNISQGAATRETTGQLAHEAIDTLRQAGYTKLRVPTRYGGAGLSFEEASWFLVALGQADSNLAQALPVHWLTVENLLSRPHEATQADYIERWLQRIGAGAIIGNAITERNNVKGQLHTRLTRRAAKHQNGHPQYVLNGTKYYCTAYSDWIMVAATNDDEHQIRFLVPTDAPGVQIIEDWDGFGQQLTASGTTIFTDTPVAAEDVPVAAVHPTDGDRFINGQAMAQYIHLATLLGIGHAVLQDASDYARNRTRSFSHATADLPREDPQVQELVGEMSAEIFAARASFTALLPDLAEHLRADVQRENITEYDTNALYVAVYQAQHVIANAVLSSATVLFEIGGATATSKGKAFDRHWRNARVLASHNPIMYRNRMVGDWEINRTPVGRRYTVGTPAKKAYS